jgi:hypothetical protein
MESYGLSAESISSILGGDFTPQKFRDWLDHRHRMERSEGKIGGEN